MNGIEIIKTDNSFEIKTNDYESSLQFKECTIYKQNIVRIVLQSNQIYIVTNSGNNIPEFTNSESEAIERKILYIAKVNNQTATDLKNLYDLIK